MAKRKSPGFQSDACKEALMLFSLLAKESQLTFIINQLTTKGLHARGTARNNYSAVVKTLTKFSQLKATDELAQIAKKDFATVPVQIPSVSVPTVDAPKASTLTIAPIEKARPSTGREPLFTVAATPKGRGAAPGTTTSLVLTKAEPKPVNMPKMPPVKNETEAKASTQKQKADKLALEHLTKYKALTLEEAYPYIKVAPLKNGKVSEKVIVLGTVNGYHEGYYHKIYCSVNGKVPSRANAQNVYKTDSNETVAINSVVTTTKAKPTEHWIRLLKYEDGLLFNYQKIAQEGPRKDKKVEKFYHLEDGAINEITPSTYKMLLAAKNAKPDPTDDI